MDSNSTVKSLLYLRIHHVQNGTYMASVINEPVRTSTQPPQREYDDTGALYYVIAVVFMYGFSIILMIGSSIKKSKNDHGVRKYMKDMDKIKRLARRQEKFKTRLVMYGKRYRKVLGSDRAELSVEDSYDVIPEDAAESESCDHPVSPGHATKHTVHFASTNDPDCGQNKLNITSIDRVNEIQPAHVRSAEDNDDAFQDNVQSPCFEQCHVGDLPLSV